MLAIILYVVLGGLLALAGVGIMEKPVYFLLIMAVVGAIDFVARNG